MPEKYGEDNYSEDIYGGELESIIKTDFIEYFPSILTRDVSSVFRRYVDAHGTEFDAFDRGTRYVRLSRQVQLAEGNDLDQIGSIFGQLGARRGRDDTEYRAYLRSLVQTFAGRGSVSGVRFAIAAALNTDESNVTINENFADNAYELEIENIDVTFLSGVINELAQLADPSCVELASPPLLILDGDTLFVDRDTATVVDTILGLGAETLTIDGNSTLGGYTQTSDGDTVP